MLLSRVFAVGSKDMNTRIYPVARCPNISVYSLGGHSDVILSCFFAKNSLGVSLNSDYCSTDTAKVFLPALYAKSKWTIMHLGLRYFPSSLVDGRS